MAKQRRRHACFRYAVPSFTRHVDGAQVQQCGRSLDANGSHTPAALSETLIAIVLQRKTTNQQTGYTETEHNLRLTLGYFVGPHEFPRTCHLDRSHPLGTIQCETTNGILCNFSRPNTTDSNAAIPSGLCRPLRSSRHIKDWNRRRVTAQTAWLVRSVSTDFATQ